MRLLVEHGADPDIPTLAPPFRRARGGTTAENDEERTVPAVLPAAPGVWVATDLTRMGPDPSGLPPYKEGDPGVYPIHAASGVGYGEGFAGNAHRHAPDAWLDTVRYLVELGADVNQRDHNGYSAIHVQVDPARVGEFLAAQREISALDEEAGVPWRSVQRTAVFGDTYRFVITTPLASFAQLDRTGDQRARAGIVSRIRNVITSRATYAVRTAPTLDNPLPEGETPALMLVQIVSIAPGRQQEYPQVMAEDVLPHFDGVEMHHTTGALTFGGEGGYVHVFHVENFAALDQGSPLACALGAPAALEVMAKLSGVVTRSEQAGRRGGRTAIDTNAPPRDPALPFIPTAIQVMTTAHRYDRARRERLDPATGASSGCALSTTSNRPSSGSTTALLVVHRHGHLLKDATSAPTSLSFTSAGEICALL